MDPAGLARALDEQPLTGKRIGSLLIARGLADPDDVARALAELHGVPAVLARHFAARDHALAELVTPEHARANMLLPIARRAAASWSCAPVILGPRSSLHSRTWSMAS